VSEKDLTALWEEDGDLERMKAFFQSIDADLSKKDQIKHLTLEKLAQADAASKPDQLHTAGKIPNPAPIPATNLSGSTWKERFAALRRGWGFKLAVPVVLLGLLLIGLQLRNPQLSDLGVGNSGQQQSVKSEAAPPETERLKRSPNMSALSEDKAAGSYSSIAGTPLPVPEVPPADSGVARKITQNLAVSMQVDDVQAVTDKISSLAQAAGGYVVESRQNGTGRNSTGNISVKLPAPKLNGFKAEIPSWGTVLDQHLTSNDITNQYYDAENRLQSWEAEQKRYLDILNQAKSVDDILKVENSLANIRQQIEQLKGQLKLWNNQVDFSTVQFQLTTKPSPDVQVSNSWQPVSWFKTWVSTKNAVLKTISVTWNGLNYLIIGIGYTIPYLIVIALGWLGYRYWKRKKGS